MKCRVISSAFLIATVVVADEQWAAAAEVQTPSPPIVLKAAHLFDSVSGRLVAPGLVVVSGGKIQSIGSDAKMPGDAQVIDLGDATLMPGYVDAHVHLDGESSGKWYEDFYAGMMRFPAEEALRGAHFAKVTLEAGVTTVRDLGSYDYVSLGLRNAIRAGLIEGPRMMIANYAIGSTGGHADKVPVPWQRIAPAGPIEGVCNGADECRAAVRYQIKYGADVIKFMPSGGVLSLSDPVDAPEMSQDEMNAIVSEAHAWNRKVAAHCHGDRAAKMALVAGVDSIEHGTFLQDDTLREMKRKHVYLVATLFAGVWVGQNAESFPPRIAEKARSVSTQIQVMFQHAVKIGVPIAMGTDASVEPHGLNAREFSLMTKNGLTPAQALIAGTANGAELLGIADQTGTLQPGKSADIVGVAGNPLINIQTTEHPIFIMKEGAIYTSGARSR